MKKILTISTTEKLHSSSTKKMFEQHSFDEIIVCDHVYKGLTSNKQEGLLRFLAETFPNSIVRVAIILNYTF